MEWNIDFITHEDYKNHVKAFFEEVLACSTANNLVDFNKNIIDPVKLTFSYFTTGQSKEHVVSAEVARQQDKTINNSIGYFHQKIFSYIDGWKIPKSGFDVVNEDLHIFVELKNKHNTMNAASAQKTYINMQSKLLSDDEATCLLVEVIAKRSQDIPWRITVDGVRQNHKRIRRVSIDQFYEIVTNQPDAFKKMIEWLPITLKELVIENAMVERDSKIIETLEKNGSFFNGLYDLAFHDYLGFDDLQFVGLDELGSDF